MITWRWSILSDGWTQAREAILLRGGSWRKTVRCAVTAVLLEHDVHGPVLFDCGYSARFFTETDPLPNRFYRYLTPATLSEPDGIAGILRRRGWLPEQMPHVIVSHWHADHTGGLRDFPSAAIHANREGWELVRPLRGIAALRKGVLPGLLPEDLEERLQNLEDGTDLFGDGSLIALALPGHAVGQMGVRFIANDGQPVILAADACWLSRSFRENLLPHPATSMLHHLPDYERTLTRLHQLHLQDPELLIVPSHCPETAARIANHPR